MIYGVDVTAIIPARNEGPRVLRVVKTLPDYVDRIIIVDDGSTDETSLSVWASRDERIVLCRNPRSLGVGAAIVQGYELALRADGHPRGAMVVLAGDGQMDPADLPSLLEPIALCRADYAKGNRFAMSDTRDVMPPFRYFGGHALSWATSKVIGVTIRDSQCGYTAMSRALASRLPLRKLWAQYGYPNDVLSQVVAYKGTIAEVPVRALYLGAQSQLGSKFAPGFGFVLARALARRALG